MRSDLARELEAVRRRIETLESGPVHTELRRLESECAALDKRRAAVEKKLAAVRARRLALTEQLERCKQRIARVEEVLP